MANTSEEFIHYMPVPSTQWNADFCIKEKAFGIIFCYFTMALCVLLGTAANSWCLWFYLSVDRKNKQIQLFLLNLMIMELVLCIECALEILNVVIFNNDRLFHVMCFIFGLSWTGRPLMQTCICVEQYIAVIHPVTFLRYKALKYRFLIVATTWSMAFGCGLYYTFVSDYYYYCSVTVFLLAVSVISFCCVSVLHVLKQPGPGNAHISKQTGKDLGNQQKNNAFNTILSALLIILLTYLPQVLLFIFSVTKYDYFLFECNIVPFLSIINVLGVITTPFMNMYKEGQLKCVNFIRLYSSSSA